MMGAVIFDVDGVLVDSEELYYRAVQETFKPYGIVISQDEFIRRWMIEQSGTRGVIEDYGLSVCLDELLDKKSGIALRSFSKELRLVPYAAKLVEYFQGYPLGVVTSASRVDLDAKLGKFDMLDKFNVIVTCEDVTRGKPDPEPYQKGLRLLGVEAGNVLVIENNPSGVTSAKGAGCIVVAYPNGFTRAMDFSHADAVVGSLREINERLLQGLF